MDIAEEVAKQAKEHAAEFNDLAEQAKSATGGNCLVIVIAIVASVLIGVIVFTNAY